MTASRSRQARPVMRVLTTHGLRFLSGLDDGDASTVGAHWNAVRLYLETGSDEALAEFTGVTVTGVDDQTSTRGGWVLESDLDAIEAEAMRGEVRFESIYDEVQ